RTVKERGITTVEKDTPPPSRRGAVPNWRPDEESVQLLAVYRDARLSSSAMVSTVRTECDYLRGMVFGSITLGGPTTLKGLRDDPDMIAKILREWPRKRGTRAGMLSAMLHL